MYKIGCVVKWCRLSSLAWGIWAMFDYLRLPNCIFKGYGHYEEEYVKEASGWKIKSVLLTLLHCDIQWENPATTKG